MLSAWEAWFQLNPSTFFAAVSFHPSFFDDEFIRCMWVINVCMVRNAGERHYLLKYHMLALATYDHVDIKDGVYDLP